ncbi:MAG: 3-oxoacyl-[acyl-carrier-protein] synthase III C-terminal domain-containing protein [Marinilabiliaceae bacterium]|jgi:3-oxoacyl-[acyl-carrier-protein] synthase-3|nr:3-oxoacyl-[acyl-carrier-protein] synthase III C-terminal domain-containing protein [Marinilabiliaceae bacterium]
MNIINKVRIAGTGKYLPGHKVNSADLEAKLNLPSGWAERFSGVRERSWVDGETNAEMGYNALKAALANAGLKIDDIDLLINASATFDYILPFQAAFILKHFSSELERRIPAFDINTSCLSFISAFDLASSLISNGEYRRIAIVSSEASSKGLWEQKEEIITLFGDGAAAVILERDKEERGVIKSMIRVYSEGFDYSIIKGGGNVYPPRDCPYDPEIHCFSMDGRKLLRLARKELAVFFRNFFQEAELDYSVVDVIAPHQASKAGINLFRSLFPELSDKIYSNLETHGNVISASIPMCLHDVIDKGILNRGQNCLLAGTAAGFAIGSILFKY